MPAAQSPTIHSVGNRGWGSRDQLVTHPTGRFSSLLLYDHKEKQLSKKDLHEMALEAEELGAGRGGKWDSHRSWS